MEQLKKRGYPLASKCPFCGKAEERLEHLLIHCLKIWGIWSVLSTLLGGDWACPSTVNGLFTGWNSSSMGKKENSLEDSPFMSPLVYLEGVKHNSL